MQQATKAFGGIVVLVVLVTAAAVALAPVPLRHVGQNGNLLAFDSYSQMQQVISQAANSGSYPYPTYGAVTLTTTASLALPKGAGGFTTTNVQVEGVDEPDSVKTDGMYLYATSGSTVSIILASPPGSAVLQTTFKVDGQIRGLFLAGDRLIVLADRQGDVNGTYKQSAEFMVYDVSDHAKPSLLKDVSVQGTYVDSRLTGRFIYAIVQQPVFVASASGDQSFSPPAVVDDSSVVKIAASSVYYAPDSSVSYSVYTVILSVDVTDGSHTQEAVLTGWGSTLYSSPTNMYLAFPTGISYPIRALPLVGGVGTPIRAGWGWGTNTTFFRIGFSGGHTQVSAEGTVPGMVLNQFSIDEFQGYLRVATTSYAQLLNGTQAQVNNVYVLDQSLKVVGALEGLAPGEKIYSVRFLGEIGYVVTFERIDPLFAISFSDPARPQVLSALELTGFSDYLHPIGDGYLIGVGKETVPAPQEAGYVLYMGMKLSLFHVSDSGSSTEVAKVVIGDRGSDSPVSYDHRAFVYDPERGIVALPILVAQIANPTGSNFDYGAPVWQGAYLYNVSAKDGFQLLGRITQISSGSPVDQSQSLYVNRIVLIGGFVYTVSDTLVQVNSLATMGQVATIPISG